jgi:hypothetical protein
MRQTFSVLFVLLAAISGFANPTDDEWSWGKSLEPSEETIARLKKKDNCRTVIFSLPLTEKIKQGYSGCELLRNVAKPPAAPLIWTKDGKSTTLQAIFLYDSSGQMKVTRWEPVDGIDSKLCDLPDAISIQGTLHVRTHDQRLDGKWPAELQHGGFWWRGKGPTSGLIITTPNIEDFAFSIDGTLQEAHIDFKDGQTRGQFRSHPNRVESDYYGLDWENIATWSTIQENTDP